MKKKQWQYIFRISGLIIKAKNCPVTFLCNRAVDSIAVFLPEDENSAHKSEQKRCAEDNCAVAAYNTLKRVLTALILILVVELEGREHSDAVILRVAAAISTTAAAMIIISFFLLLCFVNQVFPPYESKRAYGNHYGEDNHRREGFACLDGSVGVVC